MFNSKYSAPFGSVFNNSIFTRAVFNSLVFNNLVLNSTVNAALAAAVSVSKTRMPVSKTQVSRSKIEVPHVFNRNGRVAHVIAGERMLEPVLFRAYMHEHCAQSRFCDTASRQLLISLGISPNKNVLTGRIVNQRQRLAQCQWVDQQALMFFKRFPEAQGIELYADLSTRFHRLSQDLDWPRFFWHSVNDKHSAPFLKTAFPKSDHFYIHGCQNPLSDWRGCLLNQNAEPALLIIDSQKPIETREDWQVLCRAIRRVLQTQTTAVHLIVAHTLPANKAGIDAVIDDEFCDIPEMSLQQVARFAPSPNSFSERINARLFGNRLSELSHFVCELTSQPERRIEPTYGE